MPKLILILGAFSMFLFACESSTEIVPEDPGSDDSLIADFVADTLFLTPNDFDTDFNDTIWNLLEEGGICTPDSNDYQKLFCSGDLFRAFPLGDKMGFGPGIICESRSLMFNGGISKTVVVVTRNEKGQARKVDHFLGKLLELRTTKSGYYELVMSYRDSDVGTVTVLHRFEDGYFKAVEVLELNDYKVKPAFQDSLNNVYLKDFRWGH